MATATQPDLPDEMLEEIFLRLATAADLARASTACSSFRGVITDHSFLRRFRTLHPPPLLGIISSASFLPAQPPHLSAAAGRTLANADFSCSFLPSRERWERHDFRDGRALMAGVPEGSSVSINDYDSRFLDMDFAVCDPLHRRYVLLPAIPDDLTALVDQPDILDVGRFLSPSDEDVEEYTSFTVLCLVECRTKLILFVFSSGVGQWQAITFDGWGALIAGFNLHMWADLFLLGYWCRLLGMPLVQIGRMDILVCHLDSGLASLHCGPVLVSFHCICIQQMDQRQFPHPSKAKLKKGEITTSVLADDTSSTGDVGDDSSVPDLLK